MLGINNHGSIYGIDQTTTFNIKQWYHIVQVAKRVGNDLIIDCYVNGNLIGSSLNSKYWIDVSYLTPQSNNLYIGKDPLGYTEFTKGLIDDIRIYNRALSETEIQQLYNE